MNRKYYAAYEERYKTAHEHGVSWAGDKNSPIVLETHRPRERREQRERHHSLRTGKRWS